MCSFMVPEVRRPVSFTGVKSNISRASSSGRPPTGILFPCLFQHLVSAHIPWLTPAFLPLFESTSLQTVSIFLLAFLL